MEVTLSLQGKKGLIAGIANEHSIAFGCAKVFRDLFGAMPAGARSAATPLLSPEIVAARA
jgi:enoyl-[acyl-carrier-protein] reductase (NADH)